MLPIVVAGRGGAFLADGDLVAGVAELSRRGAKAAAFAVWAGSSRQPVVSAEETGARRGIEPSNGSAPDATAAMPPLEAFLEAAGGEVALDVELNDPGHEETVLSLVLGARSPDRVVVTSFHPGILRTVQRLAPEVGTGLLAGARNWRAVRRLVADAFPWQRLDQSQADFLAPARPLLATGLATRARRRGIRLLVWTENDPFEVRRLFRADDLSNEPNLLGVVSECPQLFGRPRVGPGERGLD